MTNAHFPHRTRRNRTARVRYEHPPPRPRPFVAPPEPERPRRRRLSETSQEDGEVQNFPKRSRPEDEEHVFFTNVKRELGDRAHHHVFSILQRKPEIKQMLTDRCRRAIVMKARHHMVHNKNAFVAGVRNALDVDGVITSFFSFEGFKVIIFVDDDFQKDVLEPIVEDDSFRTQYCEFDYRNCVEVTLE